MPILLEYSAKNPLLNLVHRVVSLRKLIEYTTQLLKTNPAYNVLSCLIHGRSTAGYENGTQLTATDLTEGETFIGTYIEEFSFEYYRKAYFNKDVLLELFRSETVAYFKIQTFRVLIAVYDFPSSSLDKSIQKYIDEQFHIANDYLYYLDFDKFDTVPTFVVEACKKFVAKKIS